MANNKFLPIKIFQKRRTDERRTEGSGGNKDKAWLLSPEELRNKADEFSNILSETASILQARYEEDSCIPAVLSIDIRDEAIAKSHRREIKKIFDVNYKMNVIGFSENNTLIVKIDTKSDALKIQSNINSIDRFKTGLSSIVDLSHFQPTIESEIAERIKPTDIFKICLINYGDYSLNTSVKIAFQNYAEARAIDIQEVSYSPNIIVYKASGIDRDKLDEIKNFAAIESLSFMPQYKIKLDDLTIEPDIPIRTPSNDDDYPTIGLLDSGVANITHLKQWLCDKKHQSYPDAFINQSHGTFVAGILLYGDQLESQNYTGLSGCKIFDATVFPDSAKESIMEDELIENIREAISANPNIKIWNLSLGSQEEANPNNFSDMGIALDYIQDRYGVLICKSAGNCSNFTTGKPISRISKSADSVRALVVGSIANKKQLNDFAEIDHPSPFSRIGYGPANIIKPDLVSYGGNAGLKNGRVVQTGVSSFSPTGDTTTAVGTSFSTPRVTALLAELDRNIEEDFNPLLLKALAIHSSKYPVVDFPNNEKQKYYGFGLPSNAEDIIYNDPHEITLIQQDTLVKGEFIEILEFPFPEDLIDEDGYYYGEIKITLVTDPILHENQGAEYCQSDLNIGFGTYDRVVERDTEKRNILNEFGADKNENILRASRYSKRCLKDTTLPFTTERTLIDYGKKYQPIKKWSVNLDEMTVANKENLLKSPKQWYLKINGLYRDYCLTMAEKNQEELSQDFCLIVTIKDCKKRVNVYDAVSHLLEIRSFTHSDIKLRGEIQTQIPTIGIEV